ncbi:hypothetical protein TNCV_4800481 [Trichonephila clavipes]|nr:hypothetical protein TNCV_4800481 [Trichonephila clavipes]
MDSRYQILEHYTYPATLARDLGIDLEFSISKVRKKVRLLDYKVMDEPVSNLLKKVKTAFYFAILDHEVSSEKEYNINSKYAKLDNFLISTSSSSCASASSSNARELDEQILEVKINPQEKKNTVLD